MMQFELAHETKKEQQKEAKKEAKRQASQRLSKSPMAGDGGDEMGVSKTTSLKDRVRGKLASVKMVARSAEHRKVAPAPEEGEENIQERQQPQQQPQQDVVEEIQRPGSRSKDDGSKDSSGGLSQDDGTRSKDEGLRSKEADDLVLENVSDTSTNR